MLIAHLLLLIIQKAKGAHHAPEPGGVLVISLGGEVQPDPSYPDPA